MIYYEPEFMRLEEQLEEAANRIASLGLFQFLCPPSRKRGATPPQPKGAGGRGPPPAGSSHHKPLCQQHQRMAAVKTRRRLHLTGATTAGARYPKGNADATTAAHD